MYLETKNEAKTSPFPSAKVSIIIPIYNVEEYLHKCLESVTRQTLSELEIICVNDGSTDNSLSVVRDFADRDDRIIVLDGPNGGYGKAMNRGLAVASGEYIGIVEPDDYVALSMYEDLYAVASENNLDFVKSDFYRFQISPEGDIFLRFDPLDYTNSYYNIVFNPSEDPEALRLIMNTWSGIYKRAFLNQYDIKHNETPGASFQDNGFWFQTFVYAKRAMVIPKPYYRNRRDNPNSSIKDVNKVYCMNEEYEYIESILRPQKSLWKRFKGMFWFMRYRNYMFTLNRIDSSYVQEYCERFSEDFRKAHDLEELDETLFLQEDWKLLVKAINSPNSFYREMRRSRSKRRRNDALIRFYSRIKTRAKRMLKI